MKLLRSYERNITFCDRWEIENSIGFETADECDLSLRLDVNILTRPAFSYDEVFLEDE